MRLRSRLSLCYLKSDKLEPKRTDLSLIVYIEFCPVPILPPAIQLETIVTSPDIELFRIQFISE